jgi:hypothetical protein
MILDITEMLHFHSVHYNLIIKIQAKNAQILLVLQ